MAIMTDLMITIDSGYDEPKYGVSKALSNYTVEEIWNSAYVGANFPVHRMISKSSGTGTLYWSTATTRPYTIGSLIYQWGMNIGARIASSGAMDDDEYAEDGIYTKTIWLYSASSLPQTITDLSTVRMVTQMDFTRFKLKFERSTGQSTGEGTPSWGDTRSYGTIKSSAYLLDNSDPESPVWKDSGNITLIKPYQMIKVDDKYCLIDALTTGYYANYAGEYYNGATPIIKELVTGFSSIDGSLKFGLLQSLKKTSDSYGEIRWQESTWAVNYPSMYDNYKAYMQNRSSSQGYNQTVVYPTSQDEFQKNIMGYGVYFETDRTYKPIISDGYVTGYTADLTAASELDGYTGSAIHVVPDVKPGPTPPGPGPYDDDPWSGASFSGVGVGGAGAFAKCYYMTSTELANLRSWMNSNNVPEGFDPMAQIIGLSQVPVALSGDDNTTVQFVNSSAIYDPGVTRLVDSGVNTQISMGAPKRYSLGSVNITRRMQERGEPYLDYDCQIELYLPLIGMFSLDTQAVMGRTITAEAVLDPISGTLAAYAYVTRDGQNLPIAYGSTTIGVDLPISAQQYSVSRAALKQANAQLGTSLLSSTLSFIAAATAGGKGSGTGAKTATGSTNGLAAAGIREAGADYMKASQAGNVFGDFMQWGRTIRQLSYGNNTAIAGSFGGSTAQWSYPFTAYVKIIRPRYEKPDNYNHSQGVPCVQAKKVGECTGFIQCIGVDVSGITRATDLERQAIQAALANGVFAGGGS